MHLAVLTIVPGMLLAAWWLGDAAARGPVLCAFRLLTGLPCAGCGLTRAFAALMHGKWLAALDFNALSPVILVALVVWWLQTLAAVTRRRPVPQVSGRTLFGVLLVLGTYWLVRDVAVLVQPNALARMTAASPLWQWLLGLEPGA